MGNLTEKQYQLALVRKIKKKQHKTTCKLNTKTGVKTRKNKLKMSKFTQKHAQILFCSKLKSKKNAIRKTEICKKQAQETSKFYSKPAQKQATRKSWLFSRQIHALLS